MKKLFLASIALVALNAGGSALAADMPVKARPLPPPPPVFSWTGAYVGLNAGGAWGHYEINTTQFIAPGFFAIDAAAIAAAASPTIKSTGFTGGIQGGYNFQTGNVVWGIEADLEYFGLKGSEGGTFPFPSTQPGGPIGPPATFFSTNTSVKTDWLFTLRPRLGWAINNWLLYATGGLAVGHVKFNQTITLLAPFVETAAFSTTRTGWTVGGGVEIALNQNWSIRGEYLYVDLGTVDTTGTIAPPSPGFSTASSVHLTANIVRAGINYRFDLGKAPVYAKY
jgi:outer membrane immunogenic protein